MTVFPLLDEVALAKRMKVSRSTVERLRREGMPCLDLTPTGARRKRIIRYDVEAVMQWLRNRSAKELSE